MGRTVPSTSCDISLACMLYLYSVLVSSSDFLELTLCINKTLIKIDSFSILAILYGLTGFLSHVPDGSAYRCLRHNCNVVVSFFFCMEFVC